MSDHVKPTIYLAGAIRDHHKDDIAWREQAINTLRDVATVWSPLGGKSYDPATGNWTLYGHPSDAQVIVNHDFYYVDAADILLFHFGALADKYPNIGTLVEFGRATARGHHCLRYAIVPGGYVGHENPAMFSLHPFIAQNCAKIFRDVADATLFIRAHALRIQGLGASFMMNGDP